MSSPWPVLILNNGPDQANRHPLSQLLRQAGFKVREAAAGAEALRLALDKPDVVLLELSPLDGWGVADNTFQGFLEAAPDAVVIANQDGRIVQDNAQTERLFGYSRDELLGQPVEMLMPERYHTKHREKWTVY